MWIAGIAAIVALVLICGLIMVPPVTGLADSGDFFRVFGGAGLQPLNPHETDTARYFGYAHQYYGYAMYSFGAYVSTHVVFLAIAGALGRLFDSGVFDIRVLGACYAVCYIWALVLLIRYIPRTGNANATAVVASMLAAALLFVFGDVGYLVYFNSFFGEPFALTAALLAVAAALALASTDKPGGAMFALFVVAGFALATSKIQHAPMGVLFAVLAWRMSGLRADVRWRRQVWAGTGVLLLGSALMVVAAPDHFKHINLYQSIFYGVLRNSPDVERDLQELGIPDRYASLAGTHYFQEDTAALRDDPRLRQEVLEQLSHRDITLYYMRHPERLWQKLEAAADQAVYIRPGYLGNYDQSAGKPWGAKIYRYSGWSSWKSAHMPHSLGVFLGFYVCYCALLAWIWVRGKSRRVRLGAETLASVGVAGILACLVPLIGDGEADLGKHLFMFNVCFDMMVVSLVAGAAYGIARLIAR